MMAGWRLEVGEGAKWSMLWPGAEYIDITVINYSHPTATSANTSTVTTWDWNIITKTELALQPRTSYML